MLSFDEFKKVELRVGKILKAEPVEGSEKLMRLEVDCGDPSASSPRLCSGQAGQVRQIIAGIGKTYFPEELINREIVVVVNLEPKSLMGLESQGMLLAADSEDGPVLLEPDKEAGSGSVVK